MVCLDIFVRKKGAVRKVCRCEPVTDVTGVAAPPLDGNSLVLRPRCLKIRGIATPACALVRNDRAFSNSPIKSNHFLSGRVPDRKYISGCKCAPTRACARQTAKVCRKSPLGVFRQSYRGRCVHRPLFFIQCFHAAPARSAAGGYPPPRRRPFSDCIHCSPSWRRSWHGQWPG